jgi:hypothetical protein
MMVFMAPQKVVALSPCASPSPFAAFLAWSDWLWQRSGQTSGLSPEALVDHLFDYLVTQPGQDPAMVQAALLADYLGNAKVGLTQDQQYARWAIYIVAVAGVLLAGRWRKAKAAKAQD